MKAYLSTNTVKELVLMLDDSFQIDNEDPVFDYIGIMKNLLLANKHRSEDNKLELSTDTVEWLFHLIDISYHKEKPNQRKVSTLSRIELKKRMSIQTW